MFDNMFPQSPWWRGPCLPPSFTLLTRWPAFVVDYFLQRQRHYLHLRSPSNSLAEPIATLSWLEHSLPNSMSGDDTPVIGVHFDASFSRMSTGGGHIGSLNNNTGTLIYNAGPGLKAAPAPRCPAASLNFVGREEEQEIIWNFLFGPEVQLDERRIFSIVGMGGCGKTQLTRKFMKRVYERFSKKNASHLVFYVDGTTQATIEASLISIAKANGLEESSEAALAWMSNLDTEFFMYIDNADDPTINMRGFFSNSDYVRVIITTRLSEKAHHYSQGDGSVLKLGSLSEEESIKLLAKTARLSKEAVVRDGSLIATLVKELYYLPLAVAQAGACISKSGWTVHRYLEKFHSLRALLLDGRNDKVEATAIDDYPLHFYTTWKLSYDILPERAQALLRLCSHLHHTGITEQLFHDAYRSISNEIFASPSILFSSHEQSAYVNARDFLHQFVGDEGWSTEDFTWCMQEACSTSILSFEGTDHYSIHPLVHSCLGGVEKESTMTAFVLAASIISTDQVIRVQLVNHVQHLLTCWTHGERGRVHPEILASLGMALGSVGLHNDALELLQLVLTRKQLDLGADHSGTLWAMGNVANTLRELGQYARAELMLREVLEKRQRGLGPDHRDTISAMGNLATTLHRLGRYDEAELMEREVLDKRQRCLGPDHTYTIAAKVNLAETLLRLGRHDEAELMGREVLEKCQRGRGPDHPYTISAKMNLAETLCELARYDEAELLEREVLHKRQRSLGPAHPDTILAMGNLARTLHQLGRYDEAELMEREVLEKRQRGLGPDHRYTISAMGNLAGTLCELGRYNEAELMLREVLEKGQQKLGHDHPDTLLAMSNLAFIIYQLGRYDEAELMLREVLEKRQRGLGPDHPYTILAMGNLASTLCELGQYNEAELVEREVLERRQRGLGPAHPDTILAMGNLAMTLHQLGRYDEAELMGREVLDKRQRGLGPDHPHTLLAMENLDNTVREQAQCHPPDSSEKEAPSHHRSQSTSPSLGSASPR